MDQPYYRPELYSKRDSTRSEITGGELGLPDAGNTFLAHNFVVLTAGALAAVASAGVLSCGLVADASKASANIDPPYSPFGDKHFPYSPGGGQRFYVSVTDASGNYGQANGAPQLSEVTIGSSYGILKRANGTHALNVDNTTNLFFIVVEKPTVFNGVAQDSATYNPIVIVELVPAAIQRV